jgi:hypothetical protein
MTKEKCCENCKNYKDWEMCCFEEEYFKDDSFYKPIPRELSSLHGRIFETVILLQNTRNAGIHIQEGKIIDHGCICKHRYTECKENNYKSTTLGLLFHEEYKKSMNDKQASFRLISPSVYHFEIEGDVRDLENAPILSASMEDANYHESLRVINTIFTTDKGKVTIGWHVSSEDKATSYVTLEELVYG